MALYSLHRKTARFPSIYVYTEILASRVNGIYTMLIDIAYDAAKSESNTIKHGISLDEATQFEWDDALVWNDERKSYGEVRLCALGLH